MFKNIFIDTSTYNTESDKRIISSLNFLAKNTYEYPIIDEDFDEDTGESFLWYQDWNEVIASGGKGLATELQIFDKFNKFILFSKRDSFNSIFMSNRGHDAETSILLLAAAGIEIILPNIPLDSSTNLIKEALGEERDKYLIAITKCADEAYDRLKSNEYNDIINWARNEAVFKILPEVKRIEMSIEKISDRKSSRIYSELLKEVPIVIGQSIINPSEIAKNITERILPIFSSELAKNDVFLESSIGSYLIKLKSSLKI